MTYDYECPKCGRKFSIEQRITDEPLKVCTKRPPLPRCGGRLRRLISQSTTFMLKGKGWAKDGY